MFGRLQAVWRYRSFITSSVVREFQAKYRNSMLGVAWAVLTPLAMILIYTVIFSQVIGARLPNTHSAYNYGIYLCAGVLTWGLFSEIVSRCVTVFVDHANLLKKINFPKLCLPTAVVAGALLNFGIVFGLFTIVLVVGGAFPGITYVAIVPLIALLVAFAAALGTIAGMLNVFFRDVGQLFGVALSFWFWLTPIVYPLNILPAWARGALAFNPVAGVVVAMQGIVLDNAWPRWSSLWPITLLVIVLGAIGLRMFARLSAEMVDEL